ncbi:MAG TPA: single-stranded DNA-binding protein [Sedimentisphaerales bacterium]|nr:single-stranded DNA-binding protein [Sedimentisphaerales bacterium]
MNVNKMFLAGRLCRDPQLSYLPSQMAVVDFGLAVNRQFKKQDGTKGEEVCFVDVRCFGKTAETVNKFFTKGKPIFLEGRLSFDSWTGQDGKKHSKHRVTMESFQFLPDGQRREAGQDRDEPRGNPQGSGSSGRVEDPGYDQNRDYAGEANRQSIPDDDIPFD